MWSGDGCQTQTCPSGIRGRVSACSNHGTCTDGTCNCKQGFRGVGCEIPTCGGCSGHGTCDESNPKHPKCNCEKGYAGDFCENLSCDWDLVKQVPKPGCHEDLLPQRGVCGPKGTCFCNTNYTGLYCEKPACKQCDALDKCTNRCNGNGVCQVGKCVCNAGFEGEDCSTKGNTAVAVGAEKALLVELRAASRRNSWSIHTMLTPGGKPCAQSCEAQCGGMQQKLVDEDKASCRWACLSRCAPARQVAVGSSARKSSLLQ
jgi:hypothetical protein